MLLPLVRFIPLWPPLWKLTELLRYIGPTSVRAGLVKLATILLSPIALNFARVLQTHWNRLLCLGFSGDNSYLNCCSIDLANFSRAGIW